MIEERDRIQEIDIVKATANSKSLIPFFSYHIQAGFTSPAENHIEKVVSLDDLCITNPEATYFVRAAGDSMIDAGIWEDDVLVVNCAIEHYEGRVVVAWLNDGFTVKWFHQENDFIVLMPSNSNYAPIYVHPGDDFRVFGVVTYWIKKAQVRKIFEP
jgi:DNA polymerase V